ncbi:hypothetical protein FRAHR75_1600008 [Frankia sp. Hr75.2]|nr:hypothetical protein FRAHR75_1600008 [Frankia sp. Hr75.2]
MSVLGTYAEYFNTHRPHLAPSASTHPTPHL